MESSRRGMRNLAGSLRQCHHKFYMSAGCSTLIYRRSELTFKANVILPDLMRHGCSTVLESSVVRQSFHFKVEFTLSEALYGTV